MALRKGALRTGRCWRCNARAWTLTAFSCVLCLIRFNGSKRARQEIGGE